MWGQLSLTVLEERYEKTFHVVSLHIILSIHWTVKGYYKNYELFIKDWLLKKDEGEL